MPIINQVVSGGGSAPAHYIEKSVDANGKLVNVSSIIDLTGVTDLSSNVLYYAYYKNTNITGDLSITFPSTISGASACLQMFAGCTNITGLTISGTKIITGQSALGNFLMDCTNLVYLRMPDLETATGAYCLSSMCQSCSNLEIFSAQNLTTLKSLSTAFRFCTKLKTIKFESLNYMNDGNNGVFNMAFNGCTALESLWFYALTPSSFGASVEAFDSMLIGTTNVAVHLPIAIQATVGGWADIVNGCGGTTPTITFDLVTSLTGADGNTYTRSEKDSTSTATAWTYNDTLYYTSGVSNNAAGVNEPSVGDTIYSDAACTTSVTTITAIA